MIATELKRGDIIEIIEFDENRRKNMRRVRVKTLSRGDEGYSITGVNMKGEHAKHYQLPFQPLAKVEPKRNFVGWVPFIDHGEGEE